MWKFHWDGQFLSWLYGKLTSIVRFFTFECDYVFVLEYHTERKNEKFEKLGKFMVINTFFTFWMLLKSCEFSDPQGHKKWI